MMRNKKRIILFLFTVFACSLKAQIKTQQPSQKENIVKTYDSLRNCLNRIELEQYIGQTFYLPKTTMEIEKGFNCFKKNIKGKTYMPVDGSYFAKTKYDVLAGQSFEVVGVERNTRAYVGDVYLCLKRKDNGDILYYDFGKDIFPFIVQGYYEKTRRRVIGRVFYSELGLNSRECVDYYIEEGLRYSEILRFDDNSTRIFGDLLLEEDDIGRKAIFQRTRNEEVKKKYGELRLGIDEKTCEIICGSPIEKNVLQGEWGTHEQWVYSDKYIYLEKGKVASIQFKK